MQREDSSTKWLYWSSGSLSIDGLRARIYAIVLPASPMPGVIVMTLVMYVLAGKSTGLPTGCHSHGACLKIGAMAKPSAGSANAAVATAPAPFAARFMKRRRVTVSPSYEPGMFRPSVYFDFVSA